jgi:hypothetical protein
MEIFEDEFEFKDNLLNLVVLGNVKCGINVYGFMFVVVVGDEFLSTL